MVRLTEKAVGAAPIRISMISPMPFCPSLLPWKNDTPVQVRISSPRMGVGGGALSLGASYSALLRTTSFMRSSSPAASTKPISGLNSSAFSTPTAWPQSTPEVAEPVGAMNWLARPTPMIDPIKACEELLGPGSR